MTKILVLLFDKNVNCSDVFKKKSFAKAFKSQEYIFHLINFLYQEVPTTGCFFLSPNCTVTLNSNFEILKARNDLQLDLKIGPIIPIVLRKIGDGFLLFFKAFVER